jgi:hypothetical protein
MDLTLIAEVSRLQRSVTRRLNVWSYDQCSATIESLDPEDQSLWRMSKRVMRVYTPSPPHGHPGGIALRLRWPKSLLILWRLFRLGANPSVLFEIPASEPTLINLSRFTKPSAV